MDRSKDLYRKMFLIRRSERAIQKYYHEDDMKTPMHMSMGEEAITVGVCEALHPDDQVVGTYRSHALYLAKADETDGFFAEIYGRVTGVARGKAGSMHLCAPEKGLLCCSAIVASTIPVAVGAAFANQYKGNGRKAIAFFGDGACDEGIFWESINLACSKKLPVLFLCEDNALAVHTEGHDRQGYKSINEVISTFQCNVCESDSTDVEVIYDLTKQTLSDMDSNGLPGFLRLHYYRYLEHVGINEDFDAGYRSKDDFEKWHEKDPVNLQRDKLLKSG